ncbi:MAG: sigma-70 family RNA polymerase sigma factor [Bacteroidota bacterium]
MRNQLPTTHIKNEAQHWFHFRQGDKASFTYLHDTYYNELYFYALKITQDEHQAKNAIQELFLYLWKNRRQLDVVTSFKPYLLCSLRRHIFRLLKKEKQQHRFLQSDATLSHFSFSTEDIIIQQETITQRHKQVIQALNNLSPRQREAVYLRYVNGLTVSEVAESMNLNYQSVLNCLRRALGNLKKDLLSQIETALPTLLIALNSLFV